MKSATLPCSLVSTALRLYEGLGTPKSLSAAIRLRYGEWDQIAAVKLDPRDYLESDAVLYQKDAVALGLLKKLEQLPTSTDRKAAAITKWWQGEHQCYKTNERLLRYLPEYASSADREPGVVSFIADVRKEVEALIGTGPPLLTDGRFGPGSTFSDRGDRITIPDKMSSDPTLTPHAKYYLLEFMQTAWCAGVAQRGGQAQFVPGNRFATAPKNATTDRAIAAEPSLNVFYQLGLGRELKDRLLRKGGWDLRTAQETHRRVAQESSVSREFATLDLSNASDTVARNLVKLLLPRRWFSALDDLRSPKTLLNGRWVVLEKFSSMGNGFTFELETIIFSALSLAVSKRHGYEGRLGRDVFCYGDDIIVKNDVVSSLKPVLEFFGFTLNDEKSFYGDEPFRESCGGDYFAGQPARPHHLKDLPSEPIDYFALANGIRRAGLQIDPEMGRAGVLRAWYSVLDCLPTRLRSIRGPERLGDSVVHDESSQWQFRWKAGIRYFSALVPGAMRIIPYANFSPEVVLACAVYGAGNYGTPERGVFGRTEGVIPRKGLQGYTIGRIACS